MCLPASMQSRLLPLSANCEAPRNTTLMYLRLCYKGLHTDTSDNATQRTHRKECYAMLRVITLSADTCSRYVTCTAPNRQSYEARGVRTTQRRRAPQPCRTCDAMPLT